ncbi:MAG TPA: HAD hydrolase-like protein [Flavobacterium sp.]|nr:HAD hydrolase-like protein [Flavobacterium sp.]
MLIVFDFDGTIAKSTHFHRCGWEGVLKEIGTLSTLDNILPFEPNLKERFDSYRRIREGFLQKDAVLRSQLEIYFNTKKQNELIKRLMNLKESITIKNILEEETFVLLNTIALNLKPALMSLKTKEFKTAIISSSRRTIVNTFLIRTNLVDLFDMVLGEEDLYINYSLKDKPNKFAADVLKKKLGMPMSYYIGDNDVIDRDFALNSRSEFIYATYKDDMLSILGNFI